MAGMKFLLIAMFAVTIVLLSWGLLQAGFASDRRVSRRMQRFLQTDGKPKTRAERRSFNRFVQLRLYKQAIRDKLVTRSRTGRLERMLSHAGLSWKPEEYVLFQWIMALLAGGVLYLVSGRLLLSLMGLCIGYFLPHWFVQRKSRNRLRKFNDALPDMIVTIVGGLRAGFSFPQALKTVVEEAEQPMSGEIETVLKEMQYGVAFEEALHRLKERMPSDDLDLMIQSVLIQKQIGGNLAVILETIVKTIRERNKIQRDLRTLTAQGRMSGWVIGLLPAGLGLVIYIIQPKYMGAFLGNPLGEMLIGAGVVSSAIGFMLIRKITRIEV